MSQFYSYSFKSKELNTIRYGKDFFYALFKLIKRSILIVLVLLCTTLFRSKSKMTNNLELKDIL